MKLPNTSSSLSARFMTCVIMAMCLRNPFERSNSGFLATHLKCMQEWQIQTDCQDVPQHTGVPMGGGGGGGAECPPDGLQAKKKGGKKRIERKGKKKKKR